MRHPAFGLSSFPVDDFEDCSFELLEIRDDFEEVFSLRIAGGAEHAHEDLGRAAEVGAELHESDGAVDVFAKDGLSGFEIARDHAAHSFAEKCAAESLAVLKLCFDGFVEALGEWHYSSRFRFLYSFQSD